MDVFTLGPDVTAVETARQGLDYARENGHDLVIFDTAGRLHVDQALMDELRQMEELIHPDNILLTVDAMTGQDIVNVAKSFDDQLDITGLVVTKMDGDARGGGLLSVRSITSVPVVFVSGGEKMEDLEQFHPDRMADRILGMGDVVSLIEQAQDRLDMEVGRQSADRMMNGIFTFNDMLAQFGQLEKMGSMQGILKMIPGLNKMAAQVNDEAMNSVMKRNRAIIQSMTPFERENPSCLKASRKQRIAKGSGVKVQDVNKLIQQLNQMQQMTKLMSGGSNMNAMMNAMSRGQGVSKHAGSKKQKLSKKKKKKKK